MAQDGKLEISRFDYRDAKGKILYQVVRFAPKSFQQFNPATGEWSVKGIPRVPYLLPRLLAGIKAGKVIYIAESTASHPVSNDVLKATKGVL